jgi:hypothetical protein
MSPVSSCSVALVVSVLAISACSSTSKSDTPTVPPPADTVRSTALGGTPATFGVPAAVGALKVTSSDPTIGSDADGPWLTVTVHADNSSPGVVQAPQFELRCSGSSAGGTWLQASTFKPGDPMPARSIKDGTINLVIPGDDRLGQPRPSCATPATVVASLLVFDDTGASPPAQKRLAWAVPDELVDQLNAAPQRSGS